jgi:hypothetical protein
MKKYSEEIKSFIANNAKGLATKALVELVNTEFGTDFTESRMKAYKSNHGLKSGIGQGVLAGSPTKLYPDEVRKFISNNYIGVGHQGMADLLNQKFGTSYTKDQMKSYYSRFKLDSGLKGYFPKGNVPFNKGKKGISYPGCQATQFKKGQMPHNWVPVGSERVNADGYVDIKVQEGAKQHNWRGKHLLVWEAHHGQPVPEGHVVIFGDGDRRNFDPDNLILISQAQLVRLNQKHLIQNDVELTRTGIIIADISNQIGKRKRKGVQI